MLNLTFLPPAAVMNGGAAGWPPVSAGFPLPEQNGQNGWRCRGIPRPGGRPSRTMNKK
jgi:hypothetical protein